MLKKFADAVARFAESHPITVFVIAGLPLLLGVVAIAMTLGRMAGRL